MAVEQFSRQATGTHRVFRGIATSGIRQNSVFLRRQHVEQVGLARVLADVGAADRHGDDLGAGRFGGQAGLLQILVFAGAGEQA